MSLMPRERAPMACAWPMSMAMAWSILPPHGSSPAPSRPISTLARTRAASEWPSVVVGKVASPEDAVFVDIDGDGKFEVISSTEGEEKTIYVHQLKG